MCAGAPGLLLLCRPGHAAVHGLAGHACPQALQSFSNASETLLASSRHTTHCSGSHLSELVQ